MAKEITRKLSIFINGKEVKNNLAEVGASIGKLRGQIRHLTPGTEEFIKKSAELKKAQKAYKEINDEVKNTNVSLEEAQNSFSNLFGGIVSGDFRMMQEGLKGIAGNIKGMTKAALSFIATPLGAAIAVVSGIALGAKKWVDFNLEVEKSNQLIKDLTQESGLLVDGIRIRAEILQQTFETDITKSVTTAKSLVDNLGISYQEAFDLIEDGAVRGKLRNDEFLDSLQEYPAQFKNAGFSASEFVNIVSAGVDLSIYKDKLPDAIKEFTISVTEQTNAARTALVNAFGTEFTNNLLKGLENGSVSAKDALALISEEAETIGLNSKQAQELTSSLFRGAGEDAGGALKIFEAVNIALNEQKKPLTEIQQLQQDQLNANKELNSLYTQIFATADGGFGKMIAKGKLFLTNVILTLLKSGVDVYNWFVDLNNQSGLFSASFAIAKNAISTTFTFFSVAVKTAFNNIKSLGTVIEGIFTLSPSKIKEGFTSGIKNITDGLNTLKQKAVKDAEEVKKAFQGGSKMERFSLENFFADEETPTTPTPTTTSTKEGGELTPEDKKILDSKKKLAEFLKDFAEEQKVLEDAKKAEDALIEEEAELLRLENKYLKMAEDAGYETIVAAGLKEAHEAEIAKIQEKWSKKRADQKEKTDAEELVKDKKHKAALVQAERSLQNAKSQALAFGLSALQSFTKEGSAEYKILFGLQKLAAASEVILAGQRERAGYMANPVWSAMPDGGAIIKGKHVLASKIRTGISLATIAGSTIKGMNDGGYTPDTSFGNDQYGPITSFNHGNEYIVPEIVRQDPTYQPIINTLENARTEKLNLPPTDNASAVGADNSMLTEAVYMLMAKLEQPIYAQALIGDDEIERQKDRQTKLVNSRTNAKIK